MRLQRRSDQYISAEIAQGQIWEPLETEVVRRLLQPGALFLDVGANIGWYSVVAARLGARVIALEPEPTNFRLLQANTAGLDVTAIRRAASDSVESAFLSLSPDNQGDHRTSHTVIDGRRAIRIDVVSLDSLVPAGLASVLKIDTQGSEVRVLRGSRELLGRSAGEVAAVIEYWPYGLDRCGSSAEDLVSEVEGLGAELYQVDEVSGSLIPRSSEQFRRWAREGVYSVAAEGHTNLLAVPAHRRALLEDLIARS
jgi:FkbM family methyltransferase